MKHTIRRALPVLVVLTVLLTASACNDSDGPSAPRGSFDQRVTLRPGQLLVIDSERVVIGFEEVTRDSRCPIDAVCVWAGEVRGRFGLGPAHSRGPVTFFELSTLQPRTVEVQGYRVTLESVSPEVTGPPIPPGDYVVQLRIQRD